MAERELEHDDPLMLAWQKYKNSEDYANVRRWAMKDEAVDGSLWNAFSFGWFAADRKIKEHNQDIKWP